VNIFFKSFFFVIFLLPQCQTQTRRAPDILTSSEYRPPKWISQKDPVIDNRNIYLPFKPKPHVSQEIGRLKGLTQIRDQSVTILMGQVKQRILELTKEKQGSIAGKVESNVDRALSVVQKEFSQLEHHIHRTYWEQKKSDQKDRNGLRVSEYHYYFLVSFKLVDYEAMIRTMGDEFAKLLSEEDFELFKLVLFYLLTEAN
jgi:hypothetical protein